MRKTLLWLLLLLVPILAACGSQAAVEEVNEGETAVQDPLPAAAKPQLIEFYADW